MNPSDQGDAFPYSTPETVLAHCRRLEAIALPIGPELQPHQCLRMLEVLAYAGTVFQAIAVEIRLSREWRVRQELPAIVAAPTSDDRLEPARRWHRKAPAGWPSQR